MQCLCAKPQKLGPDPMKNFSAEIYCALVLSILDYDAQNF